MTSCHLKKPEALHWTSTLGSNCNTVTRITTAYTCRPCAHTIQAHPCAHPQARSERKALQTAPDQPSHPTQEAGTITVPTGQVRKLRPRTGPGPISPAAGSQLLLVHSLTTKRQDSQSGARPTASAPGQSRSRLSGRPAAVSNALKLLPCPGQSSVVSVGFCTKESQVRASALVGCLLEATDRMLLAHSDVSLSEK